MATAAECWIQHLSGDYLFYARSLVGLSTGELGRNAYRMFIGIAIAGQFVSL